MQNENDRNVVQNKISLALHWFCSYSSPWHDAVKHQAANDEGWKAAVKDCLTEPNWYAGGDDTAATADTLEKIEKWETYLNKHILDAINEYAPEYAAVRGIIPRWCVGPCWIRSPMELFTAVIDDIDRLIDEIPV